LREDVTHDITQLSEEEKAILTIPLTEEEVGSYFLDGA
jgi:hypothetical protein